MSSMDFAQKVYANWRDQFRSHALRVGFQVSLTKTQLEMICAVADGVMWDRSMYSSLGCPDNAFPTLASLMKRGLIRRMSDTEKKANRENEKGMWEWNNYTLTEAGELVVSLLKVAGVFMESDAAITKKSRKKRA